MEFLVPIGEKVGCENVAYASWMNEAVVFFLKEGRLVDRMVQHGVLLKEAGDFDRMRQHRVIQ